MTDWVINENIIINVSLMVLFSILYLITASFPVYLLKKRRLRLLELRQQESDHRSQSPLVKPLQASPDLQETFSLPEVKIVLNRIKSKKAPDLMEQQYIEDAASDEDISNNSFQDVFKVIEQQVPSTSIPHQDKDVALPTETFESSKATKNSVEGETTSYNNLLVKQSEDETVDDKKTNNKFKNQTILKRPLVKSESHSETVTGKMKRVGKNLVGKNSYNSPSDDTSRTQKSVFDSLSLFSEVSGISMENISSNDYRDSHQFGQSDPFRSSQQNEDTEDKRRNLSIIVTARELDSNVPKEVLVNIERKPKSLPSSPLRSKFNDDDDNDNDGDDNSINLSVVLSKDQLNEISTDILAAFSNDEIKIRNDRGESVFPESELSKVKQIVKSKVVALNSSPLSKYAIPTDDVSIAEIVKKVNECVHDLLAEDGLDKSAHSEVSSDNDKMGQPVSLKVPNNISTLRKLSVKSGGRLSLNSSTFSSDDSRRGSQASLASVFRPSSNTAVGMKVRKLESFDYGNSRIRILKHILDDHNLSCIFRDFLKSIYCSENLDFYKKVQYFKTSFASNSAQENTIQAKTIYRTFLVGETLNVDQLDKQLVTEAIESGIFHADLFETLEKHVFHTMASDSLRKFMETEAYSQLSISK